MRLVLDTNVMVSALLWHGSPSRLFRRGLEEGHSFFTSPPLLAELTNVLLRPKLRLQIAKSQLSIANLIDTYCESTTSVEPGPTTRIVSDPDDDVVIGTALAAEADLIVTGDRALLSVEQYEGVRIVSVSEALKAIALG
jgi:putative PIN family toxin of toxin-antitoxin system